MSFFICFFTMNMLRMKQIFLIGWRDKMNIFDHISKETFLRIIGGIIWVIFFIPTAILFLVGFSGEIEMWIPITVGIIGLLLGGGCFVASGVMGIMEFRDR